MQYVKANNARTKFGRDPDPTVPQSFNLYLDANNLYGEQLMDFLPCGRQEIVYDVQSWTAEDIQKLDHNASYSYAFCCDIGELLK